MTKYDTATVARYVKLALDAHQHMHQLYGAKYLNLWGIPYTATVEDMTEHMERTAQFWSTQLMGISEQAIKKAILRLALTRNPPTLPDFLALCLPSIDPETAYREAIEGYRARADGRAFKWSSPAVYWAGQEFGVSDLMSMPYAYAKARWERVLQSKTQRGQWPEIPEPALKLEDSRTPEQRRAEYLQKGKILRAVASAAKPNPNHHKWVYRVMANPSAYPKSTRETAQSIYLSIIERERQEAEKLALESVGSNE